MNKILNWEVFKKVKKEEVQRRWEHGENIIILGEGGREYIDYSIFMVLIKRN